MTDAELLLKDYDKKSRKTSFLIYESCLSFVKNVGEYYFVLKHDIDDLFIDSIINGLKEDICKDLEVIKDVYIDHIYYQKKCTLIHVKTGDLPGIYKLFINQIIRYLSTKDCFHTVYTYCSLKKAFPDIDFWKLFCLAHLITPPEDYYNYHQPFYSCNCFVDYDIKNILKNFKENPRTSILKTTSHEDFSISYDRIELLEKLFHRGDFKSLITEFEDIMMRKFKKVICINSKNTLYLSKDLMHTVLEEKGNLYKISSLYFRKQFYKKERFKII